ncbi:MAG: beta-Ala-His dipeptidase [bacterium]
MLNFEPKIVWQRFDELLSIPRCSKCEEKIRNYLEENAKRRKIKYASDAIGNIVYYVPASSGMERKKTLILQAHMDMVCNKLDGIEHDFSKDRIKVKIDGDYLLSRGTTLGADNGIGMAIMLAIADDQSFCHGPMELLFTVDEESGLTGAFELDTSLITGKTLINLDNEELGYICVGSAGGADIICNVPSGDKLSTENMQCYKIVLKGLKGGHSGIDIHLPRLNAIKSIVDILKSIRDDLPEVLLISINGGTQKNAIPREATLEIAIYTQKQSCLDKIIQEKNQNERRIEPGYSLSLEKMDYKQGITGINPLRLIDTIMAIPNGVIRMSRDIKDFVETSNNIGLIKTTDNAIIITSHTRSCRIEDLNGIHQQITSNINALGTKFSGVTTEIVSGYPGWNPDPSSDVLQLCINVWENMHGLSPIVKALHAGLECGILKDNIGNLDAVSIGPQIEHPHSPDEKVRISSVKEFYDYLKQIIQSIPEKQES